jgi:hypothetical protein
MQKLNSDTVNQAITFEKCWGNSKAPIDSLKKGDLDKENDDEV